MSILITLRLHRNLNLHTAASGMAGATQTKAYRNFLNMLVEGRKAAGLSQAELAQQLGKPPSFVGKYELAERRLDLIETLIIFDKLGIERTSFISRIVV